MVYSVWINLLTGDIMNKVKIALVVLFSLWATSAYGAVEEVVVIGSQKEIGSSQPEYDDSAIEAVQMFNVFQAGGLGGFAAVARHGTDTKHTAVYRNGVPVNDPSGGWFDFGTELPTFQNYQIISGPNSVMFGSSAMAGTVLMEDTFDPRFFYKGGEDRSLIIGGNEFFQFSHYKGSNGSVRTDNEETDWFENTTLKTKYETDNWTTIATVQDYSYDYDNCYMPDWSVSNNCIQDGQKRDLSIRNNWMTIGYHENDVEHNTGWSSISKRYFVDFNEEVTDGLVLGLQAHKQSYNDEDYQHEAVYINYQNSAVALGTRWEDGNLIFRAGYEYEKFKVSIANSIRMPNLYERFGDDWVSANPDLEAEDGKGIEMAYDFVQVFYYHFDESIDFDMQAYKYINTGGYISRGIKFSEHLLFDNGALHMAALINDSNQLRSAKYQIKVSWFGMVNGWDYLIGYVGQFERGDDFDGSPIDNVSTFDFNIGKYIGTKTRIGFQISDILDREFEILPKYGAGGRSFAISFDRTL